MRKMLSRRLSGIVFSQGQRSQASVENDICKVRSWLQANKGKVQLFKFMSPHSRPKNDCTNKDSGNYKKKKYFLIVSDIFKSFLESGLEDKISIYQSMTQNGHLTENCAT